MKKLIALLLALLMLMSSVMITSFAEEPAANDEPVLEELAEEKAEAVEEEAEEIVASEPEEEEPVEEEPAPAQPEEEPEVEPEPVEPEPVEPEPVEPEPVEPEPVKPEPVEPEPVQPEPVKPEPVEPEPVQPEPVQPEAVRFTEGYVLLKKDTAVYDGVNGRKGGTITADSYAWAVIDAEAADWMLVAFDTAEARGNDGPIVKAYVKAAQAVILSEKEGAALAAELENDAEAREYQGNKLPVAAFEIEAEPVVVPEPAPQPEIEVSVTPAVLKVKLGETARFYTTVKGNKDEAAYQWQYSADGGKTWENLAGQTASMSAFEVTLDNRDNLFRCAVEADGVSKYTAEVRLEIKELTLDESKAAPTVTVSPGRAKVAIGDKATFTATVKNGGSTITYQWQYRPKGGSWKNATFSGSKTSKMKLKVSAAAANYQFRCIVKTKGKQITSKAATIYAAQATPSVAKIDIGKTVKYKVKVWNAGSGVKYQWQESKDGKTWTKSSNTGNKTATMTVKTSASNITYYYRCQVTSSVGKVFSNAAQVTANPRYFALIIANSDYEGTSNDLPGVAVDGNAMKKALTAYGWNVKLVRDKTAAKMKNSIISAFKNTLATDVCLFYYSGHGDASESYYSSAGGIWGTDMNLMYPTTLRDTLKKYTKGQVIVLLDSCGSGGTVYRSAKGLNRKIAADGSEVLKDFPKANAEQKTGNPAAFTNAVMNAFSGELSDGTESNTGELLYKRFTVLAACAVGTTSQDIYIYKGKRSDTGEKVVMFARGGTFTYSLLQSMGCSYPAGKFGGKITADADGNKKLTMKETYNGIRKQVKSMNSMLDSTGGYAMRWDEDEWYWVYHSEDGMYHYELVYPAGYYWYNIGSIDQEVQKGGSGKMVLFTKK